MKIDITEKDSISKRVKELADEPRMRGRLAGHLMREIGIASQVVVGNAVKHRFTGKGPYAPSKHKLGVVTGRLRRSIRATRPQAYIRSGEVRWGMGSNVKHFAPHEFGFNGRVQVRGHSRRLIGGQKFSRGRLTKTSQRKSIRHRKAGRKTVAQVKPHHRKMNIKERAPLGTEIRSERGRSQFRNAQKRAVEKTYKEVMES